jgi:hypothetical protein
VVKDGTIVEAVDNQPWSGEANVHVSIANWVKTQDAGLLPKERKLWFKVEPSPATKKLRKRGTGPAAKEYELDFRDCDFINSALSDATDVSTAKVLTCNTEPKCVFEGVQTGHKGFVIAEKEARSLLASNPQNALYVKPFLNGTDLLSAKYLTHPEYVVDLSELDLLQASVMPDLLRIPKERVLARWESNARKEHGETGKDSGEHQDRLQTWWALKRPRQELQAAIKLIPRYIACSAVTKRPIFVFISSAILPTNALKVFAFADDYCFGIIQSGLHANWFHAKCSNLKSDPRYTPESVFDTFPWPQAATVKQIDAVAAAAREVRRVRAEALRNLKGGLRALYRTLELPGANPLKDAHAALDAAVLAAYGFSPRKDLLAQLLALNLEVAANIEAGKPVTAPGVPTNYPDAKKLVTEDCIRPVEGAK